MRASYMLTSTTFSLALLSFPSLSYSQGFVEDSKGTLSLRNYYFHDDDDKDARDYIEWAQGFILDVRSGFTEGDIGVGLDTLALIGIKLDSSPAHSGTGLLPVNSDGRAADEFSSLGLTGKIRFGQTIIKNGTLLPKLPVVSYNNGRILPQTFQGTQMEYTGIDGLYAIAGRLDKNKLRNSSDAIGIKPSGYRGEKDGDLYFAGTNYKINDTLSTAYYYGELQDFYRQHYFNIVSTTDITSGRLIADLRYWNSHEAGAAYNGKLDVDMLSTLLSYKMGGNTLSLGYQEVSGNASQPFVGGGSVFSFTSPVLSKSVLQNEKTTMLRYDYDFAALGVPGLNILLRYFKGYDAVYRGQAADEHQFDTSIKYVVQDGAFRGVGMEYVNTQYRSNYSSNEDSNRIYLTYEIALW